jgi:hypothetical protein
LSNFLFVNLLNCSCNIVISFKRMFWISIINIVSLNPILAANLIIFITIIYISSVISFADLVILFPGVIRFWIRGVNIYALNSWWSLIVNSEALIYCGIKFVGQIVVVRSRRILTSIKHTSSLSSRLLKYLISCIAAHIVLANAVGYIL